MTTHSRKSPNVRSLRRRHLLKKRLKVNGKDDVSLSSVCSSGTIASSLASALSVGLVSIADKRSDGRDLR